MAVIKVVCYIRVSTQEQRLHGLSLDAQREVLTRYAKKHGLKIVGWYEDEGVSGRKLIRRRPALQRMLNDAQAGMFDRIIFIKLDRYFRSVAEYYECQKILEKNNVLWTATEEKYDLTTASGRYWVTQKLAMAEYEADNTGERIRLINEYKIRTGQALTGAQCQGIAFTVEKDAEGIKRVVKDRNNEAFVLDLIEHLLTYQNKQQAFLYAAEKHNVKTYYNSINNLLKDTRLYGHYRGNDNYCEAYIDKATYDRIQLVISNNIKKTPTKQVYLFSGLLACPGCNCRLAGTNTRTTAGTAILSYRCNKHCMHKLCDYKRKPNEKKIEKQLITNLNKYMTEYIELSKIEDARIRDTHAADKIKDLKAEMDRTTKAYRKGRMTDAEYDKEYEELEAKLAELEKELEPVIDRDLTAYEELLSKDWLTIYEALNKENRRAFWRKYIKEIQFNNNDTTIKRVIFF